jgi:nucleoside phosphorylase
MLKKFIIIDTDQIFVQKFDKNIKDQFLANEFEIINLIPKTVHGKSNMFDICFKEIGAYNMDDIAAFFVDINLSEEERDTTGIELALLLRDKYCRIPTYAITSKYSNDRDFDSISDASIEPSLNGVLIKSYLSDKNFSAERIKNMLAKANLQNVGIKNTESVVIDVLIISVIPKEFEALDYVFDFTNDKSLEAEFNFDGIRIWPKIIEQKVNGNLKLKVHFAMIGAAGNVLSGLFMNSILNKVSPDLVVLCGIAAGNATKINIYSSIVGNNVVYYELQKLKSDGKIDFRVKPSTLPARSLKDISHLLMREKEWKQSLIEFLDKIEIDEQDFIDKGWITSSWKDSLQLKDGVIASGEKLLADGHTLSSLAQIINIDKNLIAGEMESTGFCEACHQKGISQYMVFRGISDYGGAEKADEINDKYQIIAALSSAALLQQYLQFIYVPSGLKN